VILIPISLARLVEFSGGQVPDWALIATDVLYNLTGENKHTVWLYTEIEFVFEYRICKRNHLLGYTPIFPRCGFFTRIHDAEEAIQRIICGERWCFTVPVGSVGGKEGRE